MRKMNDRNRTFLLITIPILALFICFNTVPLIRGVYYSFTNFKGFGDYDMVGLRNYIALFTDARVGKSYWFTFRLAICATIITNVISLILALGLNSKIKGKSFFRAPREESSDHLLLSEEKPLPRRFQAKENR